MFAAATLIGMVFNSPNAQAFALAQSVETQSYMLAQGTSVVSLDRARLVGKITIKKLAERPLTYKANASRVFLLAMGRSIS